MFFFLFVLFIFASPSSRFEKKERKKKVNADIVLKCGCDRSVRILHIFLPKKKEKKKKGESKIQTRIKKTNVAFLFLSSPGGLLVLREYNYKHLPTDLLRVMGLVGSGL